MTTIFVYTPSFDCLHCFFKCLHGSSSVYRMLATLLPTITRLSTPQLFRLLHTVTDILDSRVTNEYDYDSDYVHDRDSSIKNDIKNEILINDNIMSDNNTKDAVKTEDLGKIFEMAICLTYDIPYVGKFKYSMNEARWIQKRLYKLPLLFPKCVHTAEKGGRYDFTAEGDVPLYLSAKTTKGDCKIAPQYIGQAQPSAFCERVGIPLMDVPDLKRYIQEHITEILPFAEQYTFSCPTLYYNKKTDMVWYITQKEAIPWSDFNYKWTCGWESWNNSSTLKVNKYGEDTPIMEFQFHTKSRSNMAVRWCFEKLFDVFGAYFDIVKM